MRRLATADGSSPDRSGWWLVAGLLVVLGGFVSIRVLAQQASAKVETASDTILRVSNPSIEALASLRASVFEVELQLSRAIEGPDLPITSVREVAGGALDQLNEDVHEYLALPQTATDAPHRERLRRDHLHFQTEAIRTIELGALGRDAEARAAFLGGVLPAGSDLIASAMEAIGAHAQRSSELAREVQVARSRSVLLSNALTGFYVALGLAGALLAYRQVRRRRELVEARAAFHEARAAELEQFAGRVAHDIRNPLSAAKLGADLLRRRAHDDELRAVAERIGRGLDRTNEIISGLLDFARSGANPEPGARVDVREVAADVVAAALPEAEQARIELLSPPVPPVRVACSRGVYLSLLGNLLRNAIKYMGDSPTRRITLRVVDESGGMVRTEVADTGPGIRAEALPLLFETYFRVSQDARKEGLGLGLATVKKLAEAHGGKVGVSSTVGVGSTFWFTLPRAGTASEPELPAATPADDRASR